VQGLLQELVRYNEAETLRMVPNAPDVPRIRLGKNRVFTMSFSYIAPAITTNSTTENFSALSFALSSVPGYTSWTQSFDAYRIIAAYVEFVPTGITPSANATLGFQFITAIDYDDVTPVPQTGLLQYDSAMLVQSGMFHERRLVPRAAELLYQNPAVSGYGQATMRWIDADSPGVLHYGLKYSASISSSAQTIYTPLVTLVVNFRNGN